MENVRLRFCSRGENVLHSAQEKRGGKFAMRASKQSESTDFDWLVRLHRASLKAWGIWPEIYESPWKNWLVHLYSFTCVLLLFGFIVVPGLYDLYLSRSDMLAAIDNLQFTVPLTGAFVKYLDVCLGKNALVAVIQGISDDWAKPRGSREREVMLSQVKQCRTILKVTTCLVLATVTLCLCLPLLGNNMRYNLDRKERPLVIPSRFFFDVTVSPNYELTYFAQTCAVILGGMSYTAIDNLIILLILHIRGQLRNLRSRMLILSRSKSFQKSLIANVNDHIRLIRTIGILDSIFVHTFAGVFLYFTITFCMNGLMILYMVEMDDNIPVSQFAMSMLILSASFVHSALYCIMGEILVTELEEIYNAVCASDWDNLKPDETKKLIFVMTYTRKPIHLTAAKIAPMNMTTFCKVLQMSGSYVSFLLARMQ